MELTPHDEQLYHILSSSGLQIKDCNRLFAQIRVHILLKYTPKEDASEKGINEKNSNQSTNK